MRRLIFGAMFCLMPIAGGYAAECPLDRASYLETRSGATVDFHARDPNAAMTVTRFEMHLPLVAETFNGDVTWTTGTNARPDGAISRKCSVDESADASICWLWTGNIYSLGATSVGLLDNGGIAAPKAILMADFGRALLRTEAFVRTNPARGAFDVFTFIACRS